MTDAERSQVTALHKRGYGYKQIASMTGIKTNTVKTFCRRMAATEDEKRPCKKCGTVFCVPPKQKGKVFCSDKCRMTWWREHDEQINRKAFYQLTCKHCGGVFESYGAAHRQYCSLECAYAHRRKEGHNGG